MTALAANKPRRIRNAEKMLKGSGTAADSSEFYQGGVLCFNNAGRIARGADTANFKTAGVCNQRLSTGSSNTKLVQFEWGHEEWFAINSTDIDNTKIGLDAVIFDDQTISASAVTTNDVPLGKVVELETIAGVSGAWVHVGVYSSVKA